MVKKKISTLDAIANLLPEGLNEETATKIAELVGTKIQEEVKKVKSDLTIKTTAFIRGNIEKLKEQALKELELEDDGFRNAQMFETVRAMFAVENTPDDEVNATNFMALEQVDTANKLDVITKELDKALRENVTVKNAAKVLKDQVASLQVKVKSLTEQQKVGERQLSETAVVFNSDKVKQLRESVKSGNKEKKNDYTSFNPFLTEEVMNHNANLNKVRK
jgi:hypothetical protein